MSEMLTLDIPLKSSVYGIVEDWLDGMPVGFLFHPSHAQEHVIRVTAGKRRPHDATITRYIRLYNQKGGSIKCVNRKRSAYRKVYRENNNGVQD